MGAQLCGLAGSTAVDDDAKPTVRTAKAATATISADARASIRENPYGSQRRTRETQPYHSNSEECQSSHPQDQTGRQRLYQNTEIPSASQPCSSERNQYYSLDPPGPNGRQIQNQNSAIPSDTYRVSVGPHSTLVRVVTDDILNATADAVVSPSNQRLRFQGGTAAAIAQAAGKPLSDDCARYIRENGQLQINHVMHTGSGNLQDRFKFVIHVAGPRSVDYPSHYQLMRIMVDTFMGCLRYAQDTLKVRSICVPAIGSGTNGVPIEIVVRSAYDAIVEFDNWLRTNHLTRYLHCVTFVNVDAVVSWHFQQVFSSPPYNVGVTAVPAAAERVTSPNNRTRADLMPPPDDVDGASGRTLDPSTAGCNPSDQSDGRQKTSENGPNSSSRRGSRRQRQSTSMNANGASKDVSTPRDVITVEEYLWRYMQQYRKTELDKILGRDVRCSYAVQTSELFVESTSGNSIGHAGQAIRNLLDDLRAKVYHLKGPMPKGVDGSAFRNLVDRHVNQPGCLFIYYIDKTAGFYHIAGPKDTVEQLNSYVNRTSRDGRTSIVHRAKDDVHKFEFTTPGLISVQVYRQDLLLERVDAIVNPANVFLDHGGGAARAIAERAGSELTRQCAAYIKDYGELKVTGVMHTTAGLLVPQIMYVIHAAGPQAVHYTDEKKLRRAVSDTFYECFRYADGELQVRSLSIPAISAGIYGVPVQLVANAAYDALMTFDNLVRSSASKRSLYEVHFVNIYPDTNDAFVDTFRARHGGSIRRGPVDDTSVLYHSQESRSRSETRRNVDDKADRTRPKKRSVSAPPIKKEEKRSDSAPPVKKEVVENCVICMDTMIDPKTLSCGHKFCADCIKQSFDMCQPKCPSCQKIFGVMKGDQPRGTMQSRIIAQSLAGYESYKTIVISYDIPDGIQSNNHPNPGQPYYGTRRAAYLPANAGGKQILKLLKEAFDAGLVFTVGRSITDGRDNVVIWNDIHHKTSPTGPYGYPDPDYLKRVETELAAKGIGVDLG